ncbi:MAG: glutamate-1-semialdehyde 2,1-aminomutase [Phycisphaerae bacterium]|nr:glutamate-1-semialdehyde 2,1-aminomutase [Phycisphaerae bacterium]
MSAPRSGQAFEAARAVLAGGVNSPVRAFGAVGGTPRFIAKASGAILTDVDGNTYIDYVGSWGPMILGHADSRVVAAVDKALARGSSFGAPTEQETRLAELVVSAFPSIERIRFVNSGTEATMSAIRLARGFTGRDLIVKCIGCYHGHVDALLVQAGSGPTTFGTPSSAGIPQAVVGQTLTIPYNDLAAAGEAFEAFPGQIAALLVEPVAGNMGVVPPAPGFLEGLRALCDKAGTLLIFDEVITGFRVAFGGAQEAFGVRPDITCLGKIIGGGLPVGAYGAREEIMAKLTPGGPVYQAGTLSGNPLAMAAGVATLEALAEPGVYERLEATSAALAEALAATARAAGLPTVHTRVGSMLCTFMTTGPVTDCASALRSDTKAYAAFFHAMLERGVYLAPAQFESMFVSLAHTAEHIERTAIAAEEAFRVAASRKE